MVDPSVLHYIASLPEIETSRLPKNTLFFAQGKIYQVIEVGGGGYHKAREWRQTEKTDVALVAGSFPSKHLPLIQRGHVLPVYRTRLELTENDQATCYVFPVENLALDAAYLDVALIHNAGAYVRNEENKPAFAVTDGVHVFRFYFFRQSQAGRKTDLSSLQARPLPYRPRAHTEGPLYWRLLSSWSEVPLESDVTQPMRPIKLETPEDTLPNIPQIRAGSDD